MPYYKIVMVISTDRPVEPRRLRELVDLLYLKGTLREEARGLGFEIVDIPDRWVEP